MSQGACRNAWTHTWSSIAPAGTSSTSTNYMREMAMHPAFKTEVMSRNSAMERSSPASPLVETQQRAWKPHFRHIDQPKRWPCYVRHCACAMMPRSAPATSWSSGFLLCLLLLLRRSYCKHICVLFWSVAVAETRVCLERCAQRVTLWRDHTAGLKSTGWSLCLAV